MRFIAIQDVWCPGGSYYIWYSAPCVEDWTNMCGNCTSFAVMDHPLGGAGRLEEGGGMWTPSMCCR